MATLKDLGLRALGGTSRRYETLSGESISRRQADNLKREARERESARVAEYETRTGYEPRGELREDVAELPDAHPAHEGLFAKYWEAVQEQSPDTTRNEAFWEGLWQDLEQAAAIPMPDNHDDRAAWDKAIVDAMDALADAYDIEWDQDDWDDIFYH